MEEPRYDPRLTNRDLAPLADQNWSAYNYFTLWLADVQSLGGYVTAGSLFALGLAGWQVLVALLLGITLVYLLCLLVAKPSQELGVPYPVICRSVFGVFGANVAAVVRGLIAVPWFGIQTYLASMALNVLLLKVFPNLAEYSDINRHGFAGLSPVGWAAFLSLWVLQVAVFWGGMQSVRRFISVCGPAVSVVMVLLCGYLIHRAGWGAIDFRLGGVHRTGWGSVPAMCGAVALVVSYFCGPMLNFGDFARYGETFAAVKRGSWYGLPVNFVAFSLLVVVSTSLTMPVFGELITDPVRTVARIDNTTAIVLGACAFSVATVGINIVANMISPAFDFSNIRPQHIDWRRGGVIAAVGAVAITPWNLYNNPEVIRYTLEVLGAFIGPLFGVLVSGYYLVHKRHVVVDDLYSTDSTGRYWYRRGYNPAALIAMLAGAVPAVLPPLLGEAVYGMRTAANYSWFLGCGVAVVVHCLLARPRSVPAVG